MAAPGEVWDLVIVEDDRGFADTLEEWLRLVMASPVHLRRYTHLREAMEGLAEAPASLVLLDLNLPDSQELATLRTLIGRYPQLPIIVLTGLVDPSLALAAVEAGAEDFISKSDLTATHLWERMQVSRARHARQLTLFAQLQRVSDSLKGERPSDPAV